MRVLTRPQPAMPSLFGKPEGIDPARLARLPDAMRGEGLRLLIEMGLTRAQVARRAGMSSDDVAHLLGRNISPFRRGDHTDIAEVSE